MSWDWARRPSKAWWRERKPRRPVGWLSLKPGILCHGATLTYANLEQMILLAAPAAGDVQTAAMLDSLGLSQLKSYVSVTGLNATEFISKTAVIIDGEPRGLMALIPERPLAADDLRGIPHDATVALAFRADGTAVYETFVEMIGLIEPRSVAMIDEQLAALKEGLGIDIREDLLGSLGDVWHLYTAPQNGGVITGWTASVSVRDAKTLALVHNKILGVINGQVFQANGAGLIRSSQQGELTIHSLVIPDDDFFVVPSWCLTDDQLVFALFPQAIRAHMARMNEDSLATAAEVAPFFTDDNPPFALAYYDTPRSASDHLPLAADWGSHGGGGDAAGGACHRYFDSAFRLFDRETLETGNCHQAAHRGGYRD